MLSNSAQRSVSIDQEAQAIPKEFLPNAVTSGHKPLSVMSGD